MPCCPGRRCRRHDGRTRDGQGGLRHRPAAPPTRRSGDSVRPEVPRDPPGDLAFPPRRGGAGLRADGGREGSGGVSTYFAAATEHTMVQGSISSQSSVGETADSATVARRGRPLFSRRKVRVNAVRLALLVVIVGGRQLLTN